MTDIANKRGMDKVEIPRSILTFINLMFMSILLWGSVTLLQWACDTKFAHAKAVETSDITAEFREHQLGCLAKNIYYEAGSEPFEGKVAVAQAVSYTHLTLPTNREV